MTIEIFFLGYGLYVVVWRDGCGMARWCCLVGEDGCWSLDVAYWVAEIGATVGGFEAEICVGELVGWGDLRCLVYCLGCFVWWSVCASLF